MGQYYLALLQNEKTNEIKEYKKRGWLKLTEHSFINDFTMAIASELYQNPTKVAWIGDYAKQEELDELNIPYEKANWGRQNDTLPNTQLLYHYRLIVNHTTKEYIDMEKFLNFNNEYFESDRCVCPFSILTAIGNGRGGGDYFNEINNDKVGSWAWNTISIEERDYDTTGLTERADLFLTDCYKELDEETLKALNEIGAKIVGLDNSDDAEDDVEDNTQTIRAKIELITFATDDFVEDVKTSCSEYIYDVEVLNETTEEDYTTLICNFDVDGNHNFYDIITDCKTVADADILEVYNKQAGK